MGLFNLLENTVIGTLQATIGVAKAGVGVITEPISDDRLLEDGKNNISEGLKKIGSCDD